MESKELSGSLFCEIKFLVFEVEDFVRLYSRILRFDVYFASTITKKIVITDLSQKLET